MMFMQKMVPLVSAKLGDKIKAYGTAIPTPTLAASSACTRRGRKESSPFYRLKTHMPS
jgi:hypothetical protein